MTRTLAGDDLISLPYGDRKLEVSLPGSQLMGVFSPHSPEPCRETCAEIRRALDAPIGAAPLRRAARDAERVVIIADDMTRLTPLDAIVPELLDELNAAGVREDQVKVLIALGTHRPMTEAEIVREFGPETFERVEIINHPWRDPAHLTDMGLTPNGTPISVATLAIEADFIIGLGTIVPHHIPGFSAGAKIVQPGITGPETTGATHLLSTRAERTLLGALENPVRHEMETIAERVGLSSVLNCILTPHGELVKAYYGEFRQAFRAGAAHAREVYGVAIPARADVVLASSFPCDIEFWQAHKTLYPAELSVKEGGTIIVVTPCPEGVTMTHQEMLNYTLLEPERILELIENGAIKDVVSGALALAWAKARRHANVFIVSDGIPNEEARALGFTPFASVEDALGAALKRNRDSPSISVLTHAPDTLPIVG